MARLEQRNAMSDLSGLRVTIPNINTLSISPGEYDQTQDETGQETMTVQVNGVAIVALGADGERQSGFNTVFNKGGWRIEIERINRLACIRFLQLRLASRLFWPHSVNKYINDIMRWRHIAGLRY